VLPKFKSDLKADKRFYLPKETIHADLQVDYFFGKPVAGGNVKVTASTFDVAFKDFQTWEGKTDTQGHVKFDIKLPDYFVGQPLNKGNALVKLEAKVTDTADHTETITKTYPVSAQAIQVSLIAEGGRLVPDMENRIFTAAVYPDGSPAAKCNIKIWRAGLRERPEAANSKPLAEVKTNEAGLAESQPATTTEERNQGG
jgi:5-hydroxyisourate hydrolase-like protein (transthyretin family)